MLPGLSPFTKQSFADIRVTKLELGNEENFLIEQTDDPAGLTGWRFAANSRKSSVTIEGLISGTRYWFRVTAEGAAGPGPASTAATKVVP